MKKKREEKKNRKPKIPIPAGDELQFDEKTYFMLR